MKTELAVLILGLVLGGTADARQVSPVATGRTQSADELWDVPIVADRPPAMDDHVAVSQTRAAVRSLKVEEARNQVVDRRETDAQAWITLVGWHPGASAFADPATHEPRLVLFRLPHSQRYR